MIIEVEAIRPPITGSDPISEISSRRYEAQDFQKLYKQEYDSHQETKRKLQAAYDKIEYLEQRIEKLEADNAYLRKLLFGKKAEKRAVELEVVIGEQGPKSGKHGAQVGHKGHGRKIPFHLKLWQDHVHRLAQEDQYCPLCGLELEEMKSEKISYEVSLMDVHYVLFRHRRKKYRKTCNCPKPILISPGPLKLWEKGLYSMELWIKVVVDKYGYGMPLERQIGMMAEESLEVSSGVLADGLMRLAVLLKPLYELMLKKIAFERLVHADETRWQNWASRYAEEREEEKTQQWLWGLFSEAYHVFIIDASRGAKVLKEHLGQGEAETILPTLICDRYKAYQALGTELAYCWAHVRRDFLKLKVQYAGQEALVKWSDQWLNWIGELYGLNRLRLEHRHEPEVFQGYQNQLQEVLDRMQVSMHAPYPTKTQSDQMQSMKNHWEGLTRFMQDPEIPLDNNRAERELRTPVVGRKNFYGTHSDRSTEATAIFYSLISTCKRHGVNSRKFLKRYLTACIQNRSAPLQDSVLESFLPHLYAKLHPEDLV